eukprot:5442919-Amphidinium_carterae.1
MEVCRFFILEGLGDNVREDMEAIPNGRANVCRGSTPHHSSLCPAFVTAAQGIGRNVLAHEGHIERDCEVVLPTDVLTLLLCRCEIPLR